MNWLFDVGQEVQSRAANETAQQAREKAMDAAAATGDLRRRLEVMALANQALFEVLQERLGITENEVIRRMAQIDVRDGKRDGKIAPHVVACRKCKRSVSSVRQTCLFCGEAVTAGPLFGKT